MKFDSSQFPILPSQQQLAELNDLLGTAAELYQIYAALERHPRVSNSPKSLEIFNSCAEQLHQDITILEEQFEALVSLSHASPVSVLGKSETRQASFTQGEDPEETRGASFIPDVEPVDLNRSVFEIVRRAFQIEALFDRQLNPALASAQTGKQLKLELQLKMVILSSQQRLRLLEDRYGFARSKSLLFQGLRRQTTRFLSALSGEQRTDLDP